MTQIIVLRTELRDGVGTAYPVMTGFLPASRLQALSSVPAFTPNTAHADIAKNVDSNPVHDWQRPEIVEKIEAIKERFSRAAEIMPNPVLLASEVALQARVLHTYDGVQLVEVDLPDDSRPLVVLDGQHRIRGIAASTQSDNVLPFVLLASLDARTYNPSTFARVFAEVTTQSSELDRLHGDWLSYAFDLDQYEPTLVPPAAPVLSAAKRAMAVVTRLCSWTPAPPQVNDFYDHIKFNPKAPCTPPQGGGFLYTATELSSLVREHYFDNQNRTTNLSTNEIAENLATALRALVDVCTTPNQRSVFFGDQDFRHQPMQDAFLAGVLHHLAVHGAPGNWASLLRNLQFDSSNWNFRSWVARMDGNTGGRSAALAKSVFRAFFENQALPSSVANIPLHLKGDAAEISLKFAPVVNGRATRATGHQVQQFPISRMGVAPQVSGTQRVTLISQSSNIIKLTAYDQDSPRDELSGSAMRSRGITIDQPASDAKELRFSVEYYGGVTDTLKVNVNW